MASLPGRFGLCQAIYEGRFSGIAGKNAENIQFYSIQQERFLSEAANENKNWIKVNVFITRY
jgi:hypothetical protein